MNQKLTRRASRENAFKVVFASSFMVQDEVEEIESSEDQEPSSELEDCELDEFGQNLVDQYKAHKEEIDAMIGSHLKGWTLQRLPRVSLTVLRVALSELLYGEEKLPSVAINEAVEITKKYGADGDHQFVNGILGVIAQELSQEETAAPAEQE